MQMASKKRTNSKAHWSRNINARNESLNALKYFNPGYGYWVKVD